MIFDCRRDGSGARTPSHQELLESFDNRLQVMRDRVWSVAYKYQTSVYLVGRPGTSKTHTVCEELARLGLSWVYRNARMTPMGLFDCLEEHPEHVIVLDDIAGLVKNEQSLQILLAALDGKPGEARPVHYRRQDVERKAPFSGGIIAISNVPLRTDRLALALGSRISMVEHEPTDDEIAAFMRHLAEKGFEDLVPNECHEVAEFLIAESRDFDRRLDLRFLTKGWNDFRQCKHGRSRTPWKDLIRTSLRKPATEPTVPQTREAKVECQRERVRDALVRFPGQRKSQIAASGLKPSTFYVRLREVESTVS